MDEIIEPTNKPASSRAVIASIWTPRILLISIFALMAVLAWRDGVRVRHWTWDITAPLRVINRRDQETTIDRDYEWARKSAAEGTLNQYDKMQTQRFTDANWLEEPPLRLLIFGEWGKWSINHFPKADHWSNDHSGALAAPLLRFNLYMEAVGLVAVFLLVRLWVIRGATRGIIRDVIRGQPPTTVATDSTGWIFRTSIDAALAILLICLNPKFVRNWNIWPDWNIWIIMMLLLAASALMEIPSQRWFFRGWIPATVAVLLLWFNPAIVLSAYGWPAWDVWIIPVFLLAALLASLDFWFTTGIVIGIGVMLNSHQALAIPVFLIWSLFLLRPMVSLRFACGTVIAVALIAAPWLLTFIPADEIANARAVQATVGEPSMVPIGVFKLARSIDVPAVIWICCILGAAIGLPWVAWLTLKIPNEPQLQPQPKWRTVLASPWAWRGIAAFSVIALVIWPWLLKRNRADWPIGVAASALLIVAIQLIRPRGIALLAAAASSVALLLCMSVFQASTAWYDCGFNFTTIHYPSLSVGLTDNLPGVMAGDYDWQNLGETAFTIPAHTLWHYPVTPTEILVGKFLSWLFLTTLVLCCLGGGMHARRRSPRVLIAITAGWLMFFCFAPQVHERYLLFAAGISCLCAGVSTGMALLGLFLTITSFVMLFNTMLASASYTDRYRFGSELARQFPHWFTAKSGDKLLNTLSATHPDLGYAVILTALIFLYYSIAPTTKFMYDPPSTHSTLGRLLCRMWNWKV